MLRHNQYTDAGAASQALLDRPERELPAAVRYAEMRGLESLLIPCRPDKTPRERFAHFAETTAARFRRWFAIYDKQPSAPEGWRDGDRVWGLRLGTLWRGHRCDLGVLDCDSAAAIELVKSRPHLRTHWWVQSPRVGGGMHYYFVAGEGVDKGFEGIEGINFKRNPNSYAIAPHSVTDAGVYVPAPNFGEGLPPTITLEMLLDLAREMPQPPRPKRKLHTPPAAGLSELKPVAPEIPIPESERPKYAPRDDAPPHKEPFCVDPARCSYQTPCIGTRNNTLWEVCCRRVMKNYLEGDDRTGPGKMLPYARAVNENNFGHDVAPGEGRHTLKESEIREMLPRICEAVAEVYGERGYRESQKRCSNRAHYAKEELRVDVYAALEDAWFNRGMGIYELQALSAEYRPNGRPYCINQIKNIIRNGFKYQRPRRAMPDDELPPPPHLLPAKERYLPKNQWCKRSPPPLVDNPPPPQKVDNPVAKASDSGQGDFSSQNQLPFTVGSGGAVVVGRGGGRRRRRVAHPREFPQWAMPESRGPAKKKGGGRRKKKKASESVAESQPGLPAGLSVDAPPEISMPDHVHPPRERPVVTTVHTCHECQVSYLWRVAGRRWVKTAYQAAQSATPPPR